jgi:MFS family permease
MTDANALDAALSITATLCRASAISAGGAGLAALALIVLTVAIVPFGANADRLSKTMNGAEGRRHGRRSRRLAAVAVCSLLSALILLGVAIFRTSTIDFIGVEKPRAALEAAIERTKTPDETRKSIDAAVAEIAAKTDASSAETIEAKKLMAAIDVGKRLLLLLLAAGLVAASAVLHGDDETEHDSKKDKADADDAAAFLGLAGVAAGTAGILLATSIERILPMLDPVLAENAAILINTILP